MKEWFSRIGLMWRLLRIIGGPGVTVEIHQGRDYSYGPGGMDSVVEPNGSWTIAFKVKGGARNRMEPMRMGNRVPWVKEPL